MNHDLARVAAVVAAVAVVAGPHLHKARPWLAEAWQRAKPYAGTAGRVVAACLILWAAWGHVPSLPSLPKPGPSAVVEEPAEEMKVLVGPVAEALRSLPAADRRLWADLWSKAATVVAADAVAVEPAFRTTRELRAFTALAVDIGWRRIGGHAPGSQESLRTAVEAAYGAAVGKDDVPVTADVRARYAALAKALAWAAR